MSVDGLIEEFVAEGREDGDEPLVESAAFRGSNDLEDYIASHADKLHTLAQELTDLASLLRIKPSFEKFPGVPLKKIDRQVGLTKWHLEREVKSLKTTLKMLKQTMRDFGVQ